MRKLYIESIFCFLICLISTETATGADRYIGGSVAAAVSATFADANQSALSLSVSPDFGFALNDKWMLGTRLTLAYAAGTSERITGIIGNTKVLTNSSEQLITAGINPYARYKCFEFRSMAFWAEGNLTMTDVLTAGGSSNTFAAGVSVRPVVTYQLTPKVNLYSGLNFCSAGYTFYNTSGNTSSSVNLGVNSSLSLGDITIGLMYKL